MKKIMTLIGAVLVLGAVATASSTTVSSETSVQKSILKDNPTTVAQHCDAIEHIMGMCRSSQTLPLEN